MKKYIAMLAVAMLSISLLAGCGGKQEVADNPSLVDTSNQQNNGDDKNTPNTNTEGNGEWVKPENSAIYNISINPEVEFVVDENGLVTDVNFMNADAQTYYGSLSLKGMKVEEASKKIVSIAINNNLLKTDKGVTVKLTDPSKLSMEMYNQLIGIKENVVEELSDQERDDAYIEFDLEGNNPEEENCSLCHGALVVACDGCGGKVYGDGKMHCDTCGTSGSITCDLCGGSGKDDSNDGQDCPRCAGTGKMTCNTCDGAGVTVCTRCGGDLLKVCNRCEGTNVDQYINEPQK